MSKRRVVVTGLGIVSPLGNDLATPWDGIVNGRTGIGPITHFDTTNFTTKIAGEVRDFDVTKWVIGPMPERPLTMPSQVLARSLPSGETMPIPVTTTRRLDMSGSCMPPLRRPWCCE